MVWRANLYIDDREKAEGDWNDLNPWITGNEWNKVHDGSTSFELISDLGNGNGQQNITIAEYTPIWQISDNREENFIDD
ncbi:MAG: hypothetical protein JEY91_10605, partial [Spirochaetaceae bacterium]|nr:hypothetical protein [Spirochaetaceae bacterium]